MPEKLDPKDIGALEKAVNDAAGKASILWSSFMLFGVYLAISFGSITHRQLLLETPLKLPVLNVDLPLIGFFFTAPLLFLLFHFYVFLQSEGLARKVKAYNVLLRETVVVSSDRSYLRHRLDSFPVLQFLAGVSERRQGLIGWLLRLTAWTTLVAMPLTVLLLGQVKFLPYHLEWLTWVHRGIVFLDLVLIWLFWRMVRGDSADGTLQRSFRGIVGVAGVVLVLVFSWILATYPGETIYNNRLAAGIDKIGKLVLATKPSTVLFEGGIDPTTGQPISWFANFLALPDTRFVDDEQIAKQPERVTVSLRGRDLNRIVLARTDLRQADFTGASLVEADLTASRLESAIFGCGKLGNNSQGKCVRLQGASLTEAHLEGTVFERAQMQGARLDGVHAGGSQFDQAELQGSLFNGADLRAASLNGAGMQGASLYQANLAGASLFNASIQGADLSGTNFDAALLIQIHAHNAYRITSPWMRFSKIENIDFSTQGFGAGGYEKWSEAMVSRLWNADLRVETLGRLAAILVSPPDSSKTLLAEGSYEWTIGNQETERSQKFEGSRAKDLFDIACYYDGSPYIARSLIKKLNSLVLQW